MLWYKGERILNYLLSPLVRRVRDIIFISSMLFIVFIGSAPFIVAHNMDLIATFYKSFFVANGIFSFSWIKRDVHFFAMFSGMIFKVSVAVFCMM